MIIFPDFRRILSKNCKVYIKLTIIQGKNFKLKGEKLKTQEKKLNNSREKLKVWASFKEIVLLKLNWGGKLENSSKKT